MSQNKRATDAHQSKAKRLCTETDRHLMDGDGTNCEGWPPDPVVAGSELRGTAPRPLSCCDDGKVAVAKVSNFLQFVLFL